MNTTRRWCWEHVELLAIGAMWALAVAGMAVLIYAT